MCDRSPQEIITEVEDLLVELKDVLGYEEDSSVSVFGNTSVFPSTTEVFPSETPSVFTTKVFP